MRVFYLIPSINGDHFVYTMEGVNDIIIYNLMVKMLNGIKLNRLRRLLRNIG